MHGSVLQFRIVFTTNICRHKFTGNIYCEAFFFPFLRNINPPSGFILPSEGLHKIYYSLNNRAFISYFAAGSICAEGGSCVSGNLLLGGRLFDAISG